MTRNDPEARRRALMEAGLGLFARLGYEATTTREIGRQAGVNPAMINYHFGGKQGLFSAIVLGELSAAQGRLVAAVGREGSPPDQLREFIDAFASIGRESPDFALLIVREQMSGARHLEPHVRERFFGFFLRSSQIIERGVATGDFRPVDPHATHLSLVGSLIYYLLTMPARETYLSEGGLPADIPTPDEYVRHVTELFLRGLRGDGPEDAAHPSKSQGGDA